MTARALRLRKNPLLNYAAMLLILAALPSAPRVSTGANATRDTANQNDSVRVWEEDVVIPTYETEAPEPNPMFYTGESYQGAQKRIYPYPMQDALTRNREDQTYKALFLENEYIKISVLPELGGRLFSAVDKTNDYDFFYRQHVIKPALIGMLGAWISGGIEWCVFHHHRNTTFMPVDYSLEEHPDGSKTIWFGETERRHRMKWLIGLTLRPGRSYMEAQVKFFNRTPLPHSILYWANVAVHVNEDYQVIFPPSVQVATFHSKIHFTHWPVSQGYYRGVDYEGVDLSWWKNSESSNSFFAWDLQEDFMGGYDHGKEAGVVHVANHNVVCGAKLWEWGTGTHGQMWDQILTDADGPYAELMVGAFSDNQPDYSWIKPYEVKTFRQCWYPVRAIGGFKNANLDSAVNLETKEDGQVTIGFHTTSQQNNARAVLTAKGETIFEKTIDIDPGNPFTATVPMPENTAESDLRASLVSSEGDLLIAYQPVEQEPVDELPDKAQAPPPPKEIETIEELYLTGLRVEQIHNPRVDPNDYYREALKRDPGDTRSNIALAIYCNRCALYEEAETHLRKAIERLSAEYTRPGDTEAYFQLGLALAAQKRFDEAYENFYRATWDSAFHSPAYFELAQLSCRKGDFAAALDQVNRSLATNTRNTKALGIKAAILRELDRSAEAVRVAQVVIGTDPLDFLAANELQHAFAELDAPARARRIRRQLTQNMRDEVQSYLELATDYMGCGMWEEAIDVLQRAANSKNKFTARFPLVHYYLGYLHQQQGNSEKAVAFFTRAKDMPPDYCFPFRNETIDVLRAAIEADPSDAQAHYLLGNLFYEPQPDKAIALWEQSRTLDPDSALVHRNLGWASFREKRDIPAAIDCYEKAIACNADDPRLFLELDTLYELGNIDPERRLAMLEKHHDTVKRRNPSFLREIMALVATGRYDDAIGHLSNNFFHVREGGGEIHDVYVDAHLLAGLERMEQKDYEAALDHFQKASEYPENLSVGRPSNDPNAPQIAFRLGTVFEAQGLEAKAREKYEEAASRRVRSSRAQTRYHQALAMQKLGRDDEARRLFDEIIEDGRKSLTEAAAPDFFAKFGEDETPEMREASAHFAIGLGLLGKGEVEEAEGEFERAVALNKSHVWARWHLAQIGDGAE